MQMISDTFSQVFCFLPAIILFTKITPHNVEATIFATLSGAFNFGSGVGGPLLGSLLCKIYGVDANHLDRFGILIQIQIVAILLSFLFITLVPTNAEIHER
jgi:hypothetical protein